MLNAKRLLSTKNETIRKGIFIKIVRMPGSKREDASARSFGSLDFVIAK